MTSSSHPRLGDQLRQLLAWEAHLVALDPAAYQQTARLALQQMRAGWAGLAHKAYPQANEVFSTYCENIYFEQHGRFSAHHTEVARQIQQLADLAINRARARALLSQQGQKATEPGQPPQNEGALPPKQHSQTAETWRQDQKNKPHS